KPCWFVEKYKDHIRSNLLVENPAITDSQIFKIRDEIFREMKEELDKIDLNSESFFSINIPTGSGKTFLAYYSALYFADKLKNLYGDQSRVIYSLPYMSIIDQNYDELINIIKFNQETDEEPKDTEILKHHSLSEIKYESDEKEYKNYDARFCYDNWQSKIITTTFVQLFNTIFKVGDNSIVHRFNRIVNSIIILDEIQAVDEKYYSIIRTFFELLAKKYNVKFIFVTATMPLLIGTHELIPKKKVYFESLNRIRICNHIKEDVSVSDLKSILIKDIECRKDKSFLIVLNTIKSSKEIFEFLQINTSRNCLYLSTEIYPKARLEKINLIKNCRKKDPTKKFVVVSTQLIEAGVDIDLDVVYRDFSPLSSINQTAGRANRNGVGEDSSEVHVYRLKDEKGRYFHNYIYPAFITDITREILEGKEIVQEKDIFSLNETYTEKITQKVSQDKSSEILEHVKNLDFKKLRDSFELIKNEYAFKRDIVIEADSECSQIIKEISELKIDKLLTENKWEYNFKVKNLFRRLNQYKISIYESTYSLIFDDILKINGFDTEYLPLKSGTRELYSASKGIVSEAKSIEIL
ncbi:MAG: CRISPR-associated helicase Cas3', partial [Candidatus Cloacimonetes bacterium]|nr:CRISPR-associated helicase Cas3' [Candidatus Cloacimonadota bacterium]